MHHLTKYSHFDESFHQLAVKGRPHFHIVNTLEWGVEMAFEVFHSQQVVDVDDITLVDLHKLVGKGKDLFVVYAALQSDGLGLRLYSGEYR